ncbi:MAG TPA: helix-turn-helix domain-containing protein [Candidatus Binatia bacterium]|nr:helix-turn-helix domain-containing protein [Candidatus Binatia bacterium]
MGRKRFADMNCGIGQALEVLGDWWTLLIVRDAFFGARRFGDFERSLGIAKNILTARLQHLVDHGIFDRIDVGSEGQRFEYHLTAKGEALITILTAMREWADEWVFGRGNEPILIQDRGTGRRVPKLRVTDADGRPISRRDLRAVAGPGASPETRRRLQPRPRPSAGPTPPADGSRRRSPH